MAYAAKRRRPVERRPAPHAMLFIIAAHVAAIAAVMSAKMDLPEAVRRTVTETYNIPLPQDPPPPQPPVEPRVEPRASPSLVDRVPVIVPVPQPPADAFDARPVPNPTPGDVIGPPIVPQPGILPTPQPPAVRLGPRFATPPSAVRPPYPTAKLHSEEEASLRLRLSIDERGRVVAVEPVGAADPVFLAAARKHLIAKWRYQPATEGGRPIASTTVITLRFELEG